VESLLSRRTRKSSWPSSPTTIVSGKVLAADVKTMKAKTVNGKELSIKVEGGGVTVDNAKVVKTDVAAGNGVIHVIDMVVLPNLNDSEQGGGGHHTPRLFLCSTSRLPQPKMSFENRSFVIFGATGGIGGPLWDGNWPGSAVGLLWRPEINPASTRCQASFMPKPLRLLYHSLP